MDNLVNKGVPANKITCIPNWVNTQFIRPLPKEDNAFRKAHGLEGKFVVMSPKHVDTSHSPASDTLQSPTHLTLEQIDRQSTHCTREYTLTLNRPLESWPILVDDMPGQR